MQAPASKEEVPKPTTPDGLIAQAIQQLTIHSTQNTTTTQQLTACVLNHDKIIHTPKLVSSLKGSRIQHLSSSDGAIVVLTHNGDLLALNEYQTRKIASKLSNVVKIQAVGGHLDPKALSKQSLLVDKGGQDLKVFILNHIGE